MKTIIFVFVVLMFAIGGTSVSRQPIGLSVVDMKSELPPKWCYGKLQWGDPHNFTTSISGSVTMQFGEAAGTYTITIPSYTTSPGKATVLRFSGQ